MKTIQEVIRGMDAAEIAKVYCFDYPVEVGGIEQIPDDITVGELKERRMNVMQNFIRSLVDFDAKSSADRKKILFLTKASIDEPSKRDGICLAYSDEILGAESFDYGHFRCYDISFTPREEAVAFFVAENKYTQDHLQTLVIRFLHEITFHGYDYKDVRAVMDELEESFEQSKGQQGIPMEEAFEELRNKHGWPKREVYPHEEELRHALLEAEAKYCQYCREVELERIREYLLEEGGKA